MRDWTKLTLAGILTATIVAGVGSATSHADSASTHPAPQPATASTAAFLSAMSDMGYTEGWNASTLINRNHDLMCTVIFGADYAQLPTVLDSGVRKADLRKAMIDTNFCGAGLTVGTVTK